VPNACRPKDKAAAIAQTGFRIFSATGRRQRGRWAIAVTGKLRLDTFGPGGSTEIDANAVVVGSARGALVVIAYVATPPAVIKQATALWSGAEAKMGKIRCSPRWNIRIG
jgi:hypothetical protein